MNQNFCNFDHFKDEMPLMQCKLKIEFELITGEWRKSTICSSIEHLEVGFTFFHLTSQYLDIVKSCGYNLP